MKPALKRLKKCVPALWLAVVPVLALGYPACSGCYESSSLTGDSDTDIQTDIFSDQEGESEETEDFVLDVNVDDMLVFPDAVEMPEFVMDVDTHEPYSDTNPLDPWVPDYWDVAFDYLDIPGDYVPNPELCGNGELDTGEECDDGNRNDNDECTNRCLLPRCGDGSVWLAMEDCDPPGTVRPCMTGCDSVGQEWCEHFCRWEGECQPPLETCGNGVDDDCDGNIDGIIRLMPAVPISDSPIEGGESTTVWTGSEFVVMWHADDRRTVLTRLDAWGRKVDWDRDIVIGAVMSVGFFWTGSLLGHMCTSYGDYTGLFLQPLDAGGLPAYPPVILTLAVGLQDLFATWSGDAYGIIYQKNGRDAPIGTFFRSASPDGTYISDEIPLSSYPVMKRFKWAGSEYVILYFDLVGFENTLDFLSPDGALLRTVLLQHPDEMPDRVSEVDFTWTGSQFLVAWEDNGTMAVSANERSGAIISSSTLMSSRVSGLTIIWTGSEAGLFWTTGSEDRIEVYFTRLNAEGARIGSDVRLINTSFAWELPSPVWAGDAYGLSWSGSDAVESEIYFTRFAVCP
jgi:cysteine-rich repeat protein